MRDDGQQDEHTGCGNRPGRTGDDDRDDIGDGDRSQPRQHRRDLVDELRRKHTDEDADDDRHEHGLADRDEHRPERHIHVGTCQPQGQQRSEHGSAQRRQSRDRHRQCSIALRQVGHDVRRGAAGRAADEDDSDGDLGRKRVDGHDEEAEQGHRHELSDDTEHRDPRPLRDAGEVREGQGQPHEEHDHAESPRDRRS